MKVVSYGSKIAAVSFCISKNNIMAFRAIADANIGK